MSSYEKTFKAVLRHVLTDYVMPDAFWQCSL